MTKHREAKARSVNQCVCLDMKKVHKEGIQLIFSFCYHDHSPYHIVNSINSILKQKTAVIKFLSCQVSSFFILSFCEFKNKSYLQFFFICTYAYNVSKKAKKPLEKETSSLTIDDVNAKKTISLGS